MRLFMSARDWEITLPGQQSGYSNYYIYTQWSMNGGIWLTLILILGLQYKDM